MFSANIWMIIIKIKTIISIKEKHRISKDLITVLVQHRSRSKNKLSVVIIGIFLFHCRLVTKTLRSTGFEVY